MSPATWPRDDATAERLLLVDPVAESFADARIGDLPGRLGAGDLLVVNDAATLPGSLAATTETGERLEVRLAAPRDGERRWLVALLGAGDWRTPTERRPAPPRLAVGATLRFEPTLGATVERIAPLSPRLVEIAFDAEGARLWSALYRLGRPVQYAHVAAPLELWHVQTAYASRPWSAELPSAGRPLRWSVLDALVRRGVELAWVSHACGLSSTGDPDLDAALPLPERYEIPERTVAAVARTRARGGRVVAVGTSVVRALEGCFARCGELRAGAGETDLVLGPATIPRVVDGLLSGLHEPGTSHFELLQAFAPRALLDHAYEHARRAGYLAHEFGDSNLVLAANGPRRAGASLQGGATVASRSP